MADWNSMKDEAEYRLGMLIGMGINRAVLNDFNYGYGMSYCDSEGRIFGSNDSDYVDEFDAIVERIMEETNCLPYFAIYENCSMFDSAEVLNLFVVTPDGNWMEEREGLKNYMPCCWVENMTYPENSGYYDRPIGLENGVIYF